jgi:signal peptidase
LSREKSWKHEFVEDVIVIAVTLMVVWGTGIGLQFYLQTPTPLLAVESGSMEPVFYRGDLVIVRSVDPTTLAVGDIVIYDSSSIRPSDDVPIVHRIIEIQDVGGELRFITKGDNNPVPDGEYRTEEDILAKVIGSVKYLGFITLILLPPTGLPSIIILIAIFLVASLLCDNLAPRKKNEEPETIEPTV